MQKVDGELFTFIMTNIGNHHPAICIKKFMIFHIGSNINIGSRLLRLWKSKTTGTTTKRHLFNRFACQS